MVFEAKLVFDGGRNEDFWREEKERSGYRDYLCLQLGLRASVSSTELADDGRFVFLDSPCWKRGGNEPRHTLDASQLLYRSFGVHRRARGPHVFCGYKAQDFDL